MSFELFILKLIHSVQCRNWRVYKETRAIEGWERVGGVVGAGDGEGVGKVGLLVGLVEGTMDGIEVGLGVGREDGIELGAGEGLSDGAALGIYVGGREGNGLGPGVGRLVGGIVSIQKILTVMVQE